MKGDNTVHVMEKNKFLIRYMSILKLWVCIEFTAVGIMGMFKAYPQMFKEGPKAGKGRDQSRKKRNKPEKM